MTSRRLGMKVPIPSDTKRNERIQDSGDSQTQKLASQNSGNDSQQFSNKTPLEA